ncbi:MAG TPA: retropepsin-like aspartic protease [Bacteroidales bacterium]
MNKYIIVILIFLSLNMEAQILLTTPYEMSLRSNPDLTSSVLKELPAHKNIEFLNFIPDGQYSGFFKVNAYGLIGYITKSSVAYDQAYYTALQVLDGNVEKIYSLNKKSIDDLNKIKIYEESLWFKENLKPTEVSIINQAPINISTSNNPLLNKELNTETISVVKIIKLKKMTGGTFEIPCKINDLSLRFIFDTGASDVSISLTEALFMLKNGYLSESDIIGTQHYSIANGDIAEGTTIRIKKIEFEGLILNDVDASIVHNLNAPLLLGQSAISRLGKIQIDYSTNTLTIIK